MKKTKKILFITPPYHCGVLECAGTWMPLNFIYLSGEIQKKFYNTYSPIIYDAMALNHTLTDIKNYIMSIEPDIVCTSAYTASIKQAINVLNITKRINKDTITLLGGIHASFEYDDLLKENKNIDYIICGEGEKSIIEFLFFLENNILINKVSGLCYREGNKIKVNQCSQFIRNLDELTPGWDLIDYNIYKYYVIENSRLGIISTSRGCEQECSFCSQQKFWQRCWRAHSPEYVLNTIKLLYYKYKVNVFLICDELPTKDKERWLEIIRGIIKLKIDACFLMETRAEDIIRDENYLRLYRQANIVHIYIGVEAGTNKRLDEYNKKLKIEESKAALNLLRKHRIISETSFVLGMPDEDEESIKSTLQTAKKFNPDFAHFLFITPWPYSDIYTKLKTYITEKDYSKYNLITPITETKYLSNEQLDKLLFDCYKSFYSFKIKHFLEEKDSFRYNYFKDSMKVMMKNSFLNKYFKKYSFQKKSAIK